MNLFKNLKKKIEQKTEEYAQNNIDELSKILNRPKEGEIVKLKNIKIPYYFVKPNKQKINKRERYYKKHGYFRSVIILNKNNSLKDGYTTYLLALKWGYDYITILREE